MRKVGNSGDEIEPILMIGGLLVGYFLIVKPLIGLFGSSAESQQTVTDETKLDPSENPFSSQFQSSVDLFNANPSYDENDNKLSMDQYYQAMKNAYDNNNFAPTGTPEIDNVLIGAEKIHDALNAWDFTPDPSVISAAFSPLVNQQQVSEMAAYYHANFNQDLFTALQGSFLRPGLSADQFAIIINHVNSLPVS